MSRTVATKLPPALRACCFAVLVAVLALSANGGGTYLGQVSGIPESDDFDDVTVLLTGAAVLETTTPDGDGRFGFYGLADGDYVVQVRKPGYRSSPARPFRVEMGGRVSSTSAGNLGSRGDDRPRSSPEFQGLQLHRNHALRCRITGHIGNPADALLERQIACRAAEATYSRRTGTSDYQDCQPACLTTWRGEVGERAVGTRREPGGGKRREPLGARRRT